MVAELPNPLEGTSTECYHSSPRRPVRSPSPPQEPQTSQASAITVYALAGGSFVFIGVMIVLFFAVVFGYYTFRGSAINAHPSDGLQGAPGSAGSSQASGKGRTSHDHPDEFSAGGGFSTHGTR
jgi:hypothetical protein